MASNTYVALDSTTLGSAAASVTFSSIPSGYTDLVIVANYSLNVSNASLWVRLNGDTGSNYSFTRLSGNGSSASSGRSSNETQARITADATAQASSTRQMVELQLQNYSNSTTYKTFLTRYNSTGGTEAFVCLWRNTAAVTSLEIKYFDGTAAIEAGSTFTLYGIAADTGAYTPKATGGTITADQFWIYHTFTSNGTFTPSQGLSCDVLAVAGGGGSGNLTNVGAGGGAGGLLYATSKSFTATAYPVVVGAGGATRAAGVNSTIDTMTAFGGGYGGDEAQAGNSGGSGGGSTWASGFNTPGTSTQTSNGGGTGYGNAGGANTVGANSNSNYPSGGGGGAGAAGSTGSLTTQGGNGGVGLTYTTIPALDLFGAATSTGQLSSGHYYYAGGGGGASWITSSAYSTGGLGGGGNGGYNQSGVASGTPGTANTGGGGGGTAVSSLPGTAGGSGVVIVRYPK